MPSGFPSHQGLILPVARFWPRRIAVLPLCVGAAMPDIIDGTAGLIARGHLGQWYGHSLIGVVLLCWPAGMVLAWLIERFERQWRVSYTLLGLRRLLRRAAGWTPRPDRPASLVTWTISLIVGAVSHLVFDCISHEQCLWLYPWRPPAQCFPAWWYRTWFDIPLPLYERQYPFAPHTVMWLVLTVAGAVMYFWPPRGLADSSYGYD